jgi:hypothetical protein
MTYEGVDVKVHVFLTSALDGGEWSASDLCLFTPGEGAPRWVDPTAGLDDMKKLKILDPTGTWTPTPQSSSQ